ncbi:hypothetical protein [Glycomyces artemisiae]|uniref:Secreted protein n=1 Tax=Glycomyces artemisiae TaxID=1076443 RepID=A0A2T0UDD4_9ACTN|nr:hypothetical protein [Glycomyces artemisiae]PRY55955.1 hypothetical protein B0I28_11161 [Glycomyces artemisiae]
MKRTLFGLLASIAMAAGLLSGIQGAAAAPVAAPAAVEATAGDVTIQSLPTGCTHYKYNQGWVGICSHANGGSWRASVDCRPEDGGPAFTRYPSVWQTVSNVPSYVSCPPMSSAYGGMITRSAVRE